MAKQCVCCGQTKQRSEFHVRRSSKDGISYYCKACTRQKSLEFRLRPDKAAAAKERARRWREENPEKARATHDAWVAKNRNRYLAAASARHRKHRYGISAERYDAMVLESHGRCAICTRYDIDLVIDHCHDSEKIRGLLCRQCNAGLGHFQENAGLLALAINYLEKHNEPKD